MKHLFLSFFLLAVVASSGCATTPAPEAPLYSSATATGAKRVVLVVRKHPAKYSLAQTHFVVGGVVGAALGGPVDPVGVAKRTSFNDAINAIPGNKNLYERFYFRLASKLRATGLEVIEVERDASQPPGVAGAARTQGADWAYYVDDFYIMYYATTMMSSYKPQASFSVFAYNAATDTLYAPMFAVAKPTEARFAFNTADGALNDPSMAYAGMAQAASEASDLASKLILVGKGAP